MTEQELFNLLLRIEDGYEPTVQETTELASIKHLSMRIVPGHVIIYIGEDISGLNYKPYSDEVRFACSDIDKIEKGIFYLKNLEVLQLDNCLFDEIPSEIERLKQLRELDLSYNPIECLPDSIFKLTKLNYLNLRFTRVKDLPENIGLLCNLKVLDLSRTEIEYLPESIVDLEKLTVLNLNNTRLKKLPNNINKLTSLKALYLCHLELDTLPKKILDLDLEFNDRYVDKMEYKNNPTGICIFGTHIKDMPEDIMSADRSLIAEYLKSIDSRVPINECKIVFLGDGGAGKSLIIHRLMNGGNITDEFVGDATPGINICSNTYDMGFAEYQLHFWDFGGQAIMYSMHRMFLTNRTLYVVVVNVRDDRQNEQARFWIRNIRSFASDAPILIIANHIDENEYARLLIKRIKEKYSNVIGVVYISALEASTELFLKDVRNPILNIVMSMETPRAEFPLQWIELMNDIRTMPQNYITSDIFYKKCKRFGISTTDDVLDSLIDWYQDLGVCFYSKRHPTTKKYMVLKPFWMLNALYILVVNGKGYSQNGFLQESDIYKLIQKSGTNDKIKCVNSEIRYADEEIQYIINVVLNFDLMYRVDNTRFFIPMLCNEYEEDLLKSFSKAETVHIFFKYSYLPENVLHRYMVRHGFEIKPESSWRTAAVFERERCGWESFLLSEENTLEIFVNAYKSQTHPVSSYLDIIRDSIYRINSELGLEAEEFVTYRENWREEAFSIEDLQGSLRTGIDKIYSRVFQRALSIKEILNGVKDFDNEITNNVINQMCSVLSEMSERCAILSKRGEVELTTDLQSAIAPVLNQKFEIQIAREYTLGRSNKRIGETDLYFFKYKNGKKQNLYVLENKYIDKFQVQYKQLMGYLNPDFLAGITLSINKDMGWEEAYDSIYEALEDYKNMDFAPFDIERRINNKKTVFIKSRHIVPETGAIMPVYHLVLNLSDQKRHKVAMDARKKKKQ